MAFLNTVIYVLSLGVVAHLIGEGLPRRWFGWEKFPFYSMEWERGGRIYDRLRIRVWKDKLPDKSRFVKGMVPKRLGRCPSAEEVYRLVRETCVAESVHIALCILSFPIYFAWSNAAGVFFVLFFVICNLPFIVIQRYNRPALVQLARRLEQREERKRNARAHSIG